MANVVEFTAEQLLRSALEDTTPKVKYSFKDSVGTCIWGGILTALGYDPNTIGDMVLDQFVEAGGATVNISKIKHDGIRQAAELRHPFQPHRVEVGGLAMSLNDNTSFEKREIAEALLDAMTPAQLKRLARVDLGASDEDED